MAQALLQADKVPLRKRVQLACAVPYALEGLVRREVQAAGGALGEVTHGSVVEIAFGIDEDAAPALRARLDEAGQGQLAWLRHPRAGGDPGH